MVLATHSPRFVVGPVWIIVVFLFGLCRPRFRDHPFAHPPTRACVEQVAMKYKLSPTVTDILYRRHAFICRRSSTNALDVQVCQGM